MILLVRKIRVLGRGEIFVVIESIDDLVKFLNWLLHLLGLFVLIPDRLFHQRAGQIIRDILHEGRVYL